MKQRYYALDVFRGATVAFMILVNDPGSEHVFSPLEHAAWHGITPTDLIFPFFLFAVGNAMAFVMPRFEQAGATIFWKKIIKRTLLIYLIGLFLTWYPFIIWQDDRWVVKTWTWQRLNGDIMGIRILGVLARIALCYFFASIIVFYAKQRGAFLISIILLLVYWAMCLGGNPADPYSITGWFGTGIDKAILHEPHMYHGEGIAFDPEGIMSTIPAISEVLFGYLVGDYIVKRGQAVKAEAMTVSTTHPMYQTLTVLFISAVALLFAGYAWSLSFPLNKKIWTSSFTVYTSGMAILVLATLIYALEVKGLRGKWSRFFDVFGKNPLFIFALSSFIPKTLWLIRWQTGTNTEGHPVYSNPWAWLQQLTAQLPGPPEFGSLLFAICIVLLLWAIGYWMDKKRIYIKV